MSSDRHDSLDHMRGANVPGKVPGTGVQSWLAVAQPIISLIVGPSFCEDVREYGSLSRVPDLILDVEN